MGRTRVLAQAARAGRSASLESASHEESAPSASRLLVLSVERPSDTPFALQVDRALRTALAALGFSVQFSSASFREAQLAAGCTDGPEVCGRQVAGVLERERLAIRQLSDDGVLELRVFDAQGGSYAGRASLARGSNAALARSVDGLVARVFGPIAPLFGPIAPLSEGGGALSEGGGAPLQIEMARAAPESASRADRVSRGLRGAGWASALAGAGLLAGGFVAGLGARRDRTAYATTDVQTADDADAALSHYQHAQERADRARVLVGVGAAMAFAGTVMLVWERLRRGPDRKLQNSQASGETMGGRRGARFSAAPMHRGVSLAWGGTL